jgi:hypothetical protein
LQQALNQVKYNNDEIIRLKEKHAAATLNDQEKSIDLFSACLPYSRDF